MKVYQLLSLLIFTRTAGLLSSRCWTKLCKAFQERTTTQPRCMTTPLGRRWRMLRTRTTRPSTQGTTAATTALNRWEPWAQRFASWVCCFRFKPQLCFFCFPQQFLLKLCHCQCPCFVSGEYIAVLLIAFIGSFS